MHQNIVFTLIYDLISAIFSNCLIKGNKRTVVPMLKIECNTAILAGLAIWVKYGMSKKVFPNIEVNVKDEAQAIIDEYKASDNVTLDKQSIGIEKQQVIINEEDVALDNGLISEQQNEVLGNYKEKVI